MAVTVDGDRDLTGHGPPGAGPPQGERDMVEPEHVRDGVVDRDGLADAESDRALASELDLAEVPHGQVTPSGPRLVPARW